jgi:eukaryotic-like serine/threonine-protein kinase
VERFPGGCALAIQEKATSLAIGSRFGAYEIVSHHGSGGMADIWVARKVAVASSTRSPSEVGPERFAIKTLLKRRLHLPEYVDRFAQEAELHRLFDHPNIVRLIETDVEAGIRYMVLEFVEGLNLRQMIHAAKPRPLPRAVIYDVMAGVCDALHYLHDLAGREGPLGLVHCDVSPENVMIGLDGRVRLIDFGVAASLLASASSGPTSAVLETSVLRPGRHVPPGRLQYLPPERVDGRSLDRRCDIYSVGAMLFELVHGVRPFQADTIYELLTRICQGATVAGDPSVDIEARDLIEHAMAVAPEDRIDTAKHLADALRLLRELVDPDEQTAGAFVRRLFGLEEAEEIEEIDLLWTEERATAEVPCLEDSPSETPLLEQGTALDVRVRELLHQTSSAPLKSEPSAAPPSAHPAAAAERASPEPKSQPAQPMPDLFAPVSRPPPPQLDLFDAYGKRPPPPSSGTFLAPRQSASTGREKGDIKPPRASSPAGDWATKPPTRDESGIKPSRAAAAHFDKGWSLLREGKVDETLAEWEIAVQLDPTNRSYAVNVQKLRHKLQR